MRRKDWADVVKRYKNSGKRCLAFCREENIAPGSLRYHLDKDKSVEQTPRFIEIPPKQQGLFLEWKGLKIHLEHDFEEVTLLRFLQTLAKVC